MNITHILGFPRIGAERELKRALEAYWTGTQSAEALEETGRALRAAHWQRQAAGGLEFVSVGDFAWYDQMLEWTTTLGVVPARFGQSSTQPVELDTLFRMARGRAPTGSPVAACEMTKWFDTNYHYIVPEIVPTQDFRLARETLFEHVREAQALGYRAKPVLPGPLTWLWLAKGDAYAGGPGDPAKLQLLDALLRLYEEVLGRLANLGVEWVQLDDPILVLDLPAAWQDAFRTVYERLAVASVKLLLTTYFGGLQDNLPLALSLPVAGLHVDLARDPGQLSAIVQGLGAQKILSAGVIDGRNIWRSDLDAILSTLTPVHRQLGSRLWLAPSCSLLHVPVDLAGESALDAEFKSWLSFAAQKIDELSLLGRALDGASQPAVAKALALQRNALQARRQSARIHNPAVGRRLAEDARITRDRAPFAERVARQQQRLKLPTFPTTTIGSFPQTAEIRALRRDWKSGVLSDSAYETAIRKEIEEVIRFQERIGLDVFVHGEPERNDMVEYFGELLAGFAFTQNGWVQSYGSRCVKPPIIFGDVARPAPMTVGWSAYAQSLTHRPVRAC